MPVPVGQSAGGQPQLLLGRRPRRSLREAVVLRAVGLVEGAVVLRILEKDGRAMGSNGTGRDSDAASADDLRAGCCPAAGPPGFEPAPGTAASVWARRASTPA